MEPTIHPDATGVPGVQPTPMYLAPFRAFYSRPFYREVARTWRIRGFVYLLLLLSVCWVPALVQMSMEGSRFMATRADEFIRQFPTITINNGRASIDREEPLFIHDRLTGQPVVIIDTTGEIDSLDGTSAYVLLTGSRLVTQRSELDTRSYDLSTIESLTLTPADAYRWLNMTMTWGPVVLFPFLVMGSFAVRILQTFFYALIGMLLKVFTGADLDFAAMLSVSIMAITPAIVAATFLLAIGFNPPLGWLLFFGLSMAYLLFGLSATVKTGGNASQEPAT
jgi:hypothetical protein